MRGYTLLVVLWLAAACNAGDLVGTGNPPTPDPTPSVVITVTPPPPCATPTLGPQPYVNPSGITGNWDFAITLPDRADNDGNLYKLAWICADVPGDPNPPHEVFATVDLSAGDGDANMFLCPSGWVAQAGPSPPCADFSWPCCSVLP